MSKQLRTIIVGAGMSGILAAIKLRAAGQKHVAIYEKADRIGGTWRENRYPGLTCDVPAHCYTYSFAPYAEWSSFYATGDEIQAYFEKVVRDYGLEEIIHFNCEVKSCEWSGSEWNVGFTDGASDKADIVIAASGVLHHPNIPNFPGIENFRGAAFHSTRWDHDEPLDGRKIGVIGCGSTGVQIVSALADRAASLVHFQRSPQWIMPVQQFDYTESERQAFRDDVAKIDAIRFGDDYWGGIHRFNAAIIDPDSSEMAEIADLCLRNLENSIKDPVLREKLRPAYNPACKRLIYSWNYYEAAQKPAVTIEIGKIDHFEETGIRMVDGTFHELDLVAIASGFRTDRFIRPATVKGLGGIDLDTFWAKRPTAHYAVGLPGFPNFFMLNGPTGPVGNFSLIDIAERQWSYISQLLAPVFAGEVQTVMPTDEAHAAYEERRIEAAKKTVFASGCQSWYLDGEGIPGTWPWSYQAFADAMAKPNLDEYRYA